MHRVSEFIVQLRRCFRLSFTTCFHTSPESVLTDTVSECRWTRRFAAAAFSATLLLSGCSAQKAAVQDLKWIDGDKPVSSYRGHSTSIVHPAIDNETDQSVQVTEEPRHLQRILEEDVREISLDEAILIALRNNQIVETRMPGGVTAATVLQNPDQVSSVYDSAIQETGVLFGRRGLEAALSDFDTRFSTAMTWGRDHRGVHALATPLTQETGNFRAGLDKSLASGGAVSVYHNWNYLSDSNTAGPFASSYAGSLGAEIRQPLLAGAGTDFTRVAGPTRPGFGAIAGVSQGVVIARINQDITLADFELAVRNSLRVVEDAYWDLYQAYRFYDAAVTNHESAFQTWREARIKMEVGTLKLAEELQARDDFYRTRALVETELNSLYKAEGLLRRSLALPMNDGAVLRPASEPMKAEFRPDWESCLLDGLTKRAELRRQKWQIKSLQLQLNAARSLVRPQLDVVGNYGVNGFGDQLLNQNGSSGYGSMTHDDLESWTMGVEMSMPIGFRQARSQVRNYELQLARANALLASQERSISHDIATSIQDLAAAWKAAQSNLNRLQAAERRVELLQAEKDIGTLTLDLVLRAQASMAEAERAYYEQLVIYNKSITYLHLATGSLLEVNNVHLAEGPWATEAYADAEMRAVERTHAKDNPKLESMPREFVSHGPAGSVERRTSTTISSQQLPEAETAEQPVPERPVQEDSGAGLDATDE